MSAAEQQSEELEVLRSIFDGDTSFSVISDNAVQYRFGDQGDFRSFLLEFRWPASYPDESNPEFVLDLFYNKHLNAETKSTILECLNEEAIILHGSQMTYSLIEIIKDRFEKLVENQVEKPKAEEEKADSGSESDDDEDDDDRKRNQGGAKEKLTKAQKRKRWNRGEANEEKPRGWNWVDVVKHLSQGGHQ